MNGREPAPERARSDVPDHLTEPAKAEWARIIEEAVGAHITANSIGVMRALFLI